MSSAAEDLLQAIEMAPLWFDNQKVSLKTANDHLKLFRDVTRLLEEKAPTKRYFAVEKEWFDRFFKYGSEL